ncbi:hypothetical protein YQE_11990, partial [Dendroctonus ponderosae]
MFAFDPYVDWIIKKWNRNKFKSGKIKLIYQRTLLDEKRELHHLDLNTYRSSDYDKLALSLISPLPNEQDFAINVCTLLSNDNRHNLKLDRHPRIVTYLLAHAGIFSHSSLRQLFVQVYNDVRKKPIHNFWNDVLESDEFLDLTNETNFYTPKEEAKPCDTLIKDDSLQYADLDSVDANTERLPKNLRETRDADCECELVEDSLKPPKYFKFKSDASDKELFCLRRTLGTQDYVGQRVLQVATILRNLCFVEDNVSVLTRNSAFIRFLLLCSCSQWSSLKNLGFDMLGNIAADLELKDGQTDIIGTSILKIISRNLQSDDRASCLSSVEVLNKLSQNEKNEDILIRCLESGVYKKVCSFLTIHDVMLLIYTLECLYSLSSLGERSCNFIANNHGVIDTLVSLVTVEGKSYGPKACIGMKLVETIPSGSQLQTQSQTSQQQSSQSTAAATPQQSASTTTTATNTIIVSSTITSMASSPPAPGVTPVKVVSNLPNSPIKSVIPLTPQRLLVTATTAPPMKTATVAPTVTTTTPLVPAPQVMPSLTPQQLIQQQHAHQQAIQENEQFALAWLRATYEPCGSGNKVDHQELYKHYISSCTKIGRRGVISPLHFPRCVRSVFGGTVGPNPMKPANPNDPQYYEGIKVRAQPIKLNIPPPLSPSKSIFTPSPAPKSTVRRKQITAAAPTKSGTNAPLAVDAESDGSLNILSPASPILKAQLSAPPKPRESSSASSTMIAPSDSKSQAMAHPHLSHALLGSTTSSSSSTMSSMATSVTTTTKAELKQDPQVIHAGQSNSSSLIKSLLATKVNDACLSTVSMKAASTDCQNVAQVAARQQRLLSQQNAASTDGTPKNQSRLDALKMHRINGVRQLFTDNEVGDPSVSSTTQFITISKGKKEPPQPPPPPLAPFSNNLKSKTPPIINEDSDSLGNHSLSSTSGVGAIGVVSSTEENDNSLTSFEGLLNGMSIVEETLNESSNSKDSLKISGSEISIDKPLRLADLLEKKFDKSPILNGTLNKDLKLENERSELLENHIEKALSRDNNELKMEDLKVDANSVKAEDNSTDADSAKREAQEGSFPDMKSETGDNKQGVKRHATDSIVEVDAKRPHLSANVNGRGNICHTPDTSSTSRDERPTSVSTAAAKLFADFAADILEDEDEEQLMQQTQTATPAVVESGMSQQLIVDNNQQVLLSQPRQIIVSQPQIHTSNQSVVFSSGTPMKTAPGQTVIVNAGVQQRQSVLIQPTNTGQLLLSQGLQGQIQLLQSNQAGQYVIQTNPSQGYMVAQSQTAVVHGQPQTVLVAQQGQSVGSKTIIILQQQPSGSASHHQKVMVTPQGQQVVVTQVPRPITQSVDHQELYKHYISSCTKIGRRGVISPLHFPRCVRSVFGGTVGPNPMKPANPNDPQYYEGIKVRAQPIKLNIPPPLSPSKSIFTPSPAPKSTVRRKQITAAAPTKSGTNAPLAVDAESDGSLNILSPASPILKAQLSAPPKPRESSSASSTMIAPSDSKSQAMAHPHLSHALLGSTTSSSSSTMSSMATSVTTTTKAELKQDPQVIHAGQSNSSSLIKSLLATKVNDACLSTVSMKAASTDCQNVAQVAARQQRLLSQQNAASTDGTPKNQSRLDALKMHRINGVRQLFTDNEVGDPSVSSTTQFITISKGKKEPPQPPPPPLAPFSNNLKSKTPPIINEDSDSLGNHSLSSTSGVGAIGVVSSTEENDNSLTSFEGLLNGMSIVEETLNESSNSKDSLKISGSEISIDKPLRLADLLEKKFDKSPILNGTLNKDLKLENERSELLENHIEKALSRDNNELKMEDLKVDANSVKAEDNSTDADSAKREAQEGSFPDMKSETGDNKQGVKRHATDSIVEVDAKRPHLSANVNGRGNICHTPDTSSTSRDERPTSVSTAAAKLFADFAADILEDEDEEQLMQQTQTATPAVVESGMSQQLIVDNNQQVLLSQPRQIIVSQPQIHTSNQSVVFSSGTPMKTAPGQTVIVNAGVQQRQSVLIQPTNTGQLLLSQGLQGQIQLLQSNQAGQYVIQTNPSQGYMVAQSQTAVVHGQPQTVLVAQQGQSVGSKTIIILQQQPSGSASHHQKVMVPPQGQQVVVTQVPRPITQSSTSKSARPTPTPSPVLSTASTSSLSNGVKEKPEEIPPKPKIIRDLTTPFVCEWGECVIDVKFNSANQVYMHACEEHCPQGDEEVICQWDRCDLLKRKRFSLMTHLHDKHCNVEAMKQSLVRRKKISQGINVEPPASSPTSHPGYAPDAALHAIKRHALDFVNPKELQIKTPKQGATTTIKVPLPPSDQDDNEGPVTKSIRLTASLILRNLAIYSSNCKRYLKSYESHLANIALSNVESSRTIAQILYDINDGTTHR